MKKTKCGNRWIVTALITAMLASAQTASALNATGGNLARIDGYRIHTFTNNGTLTVTATGLVEVLVVAGGGAGGGCSDGNGAGGGGAGGYIYTNGFAVPTGVVVVTVGAGGAGNANATGGNGGKSVLSNSPTVFLSATGGGGGGGGGGTAGNSGGSGGGGGGWNGGAGGTGTAGQGSNGAACASSSRSGGGGGGAYATGTHNGGGGRTNTISGVSAVYAGGGGGGGNTAQAPNPAPGTGGSGIGGAGGNYTTLAPTAGASFTGSGGGGAGQGTGGAGASGIVIVRYLAMSPEIEDLPASDVTAVSATLNGTLISAGTADTTVFVYWGTNDGGAVAADWQHTNVLAGAQVAGPVSVNVSLDTPNVTYFYRYAATNANDAVWASASASLALGDVTVSATDASASEITANTGTFTVSRPDWATNSSLTINYTLGGSASNGVDYAALSGWVLLPAGVATAAVIVAPIVDAIEEPAEPVELSLAPGPYLIGVASNATVTIADGTWYVATNGLDTHGGHSWSDAFLTISNAVAQAPAGQLILVSNGTYTVGAQIALSKQILLRGFNGASNTIVNGNGAVRCFSLTHAGAVLDGFTATNGLADGGGVYMSAGTVRNCTIRNNKTSANPGYGNGIYMTGGLVTNCVIRDNSRTLSGGANGYGGGIWMNNGTVAGCLITGNKYTGSSDRAHGAGVDMLGGMLDSCEISSNSTSGAIAAGGWNENFGGGGGILMFSGVVRKCRIYGNSNLNNTGNNIGSDGGGVQQQGGTLENCVIYNNRSYLNGGGVSLTAGTLCNVTISSNTAVTGAGGGLNMSGGSVSNTIVYLNTGLTQSNRNLSITGGSFVFGCSDPLPAGTDNIATDPQWRKSTPFDFHLGILSPCIDAGTNLAAITTDQEGGPRPLDGDGDGTARHDLGAYEQLHPTSGVFRCGFSISTNAGYAPLTVAFTAAVAGANTNGAVFYWDFDNDGSMDGPGTDQRVVSNVYQVGTYTVRLVASNAVAESDQVVRQAVITVVSDADAFVATNGASVYPYSDWTTAATNVHDAVNAIKALLAAGGAHHSVWVSNGIYTLTAPLVLDAALDVHGFNGPAATIIDGNAATRCVTMSAVGAVLDGLTVRNGLDSFAEGSGIRLFSGTVTNCTLTANRGSGRALYMTGGTAVDSRILSNTVSGAGGVKLIGGGALLRCTVSANQSAAGGGIYMTGGTVADSTVAANVAAGADPNTGAGIYMTGGLVSNSVIRGNQGAANNTYGGGLWMNNGRVTRSTISGNSLASSDRCHGGGIDMYGGTVDFCTISNNSLSTSVYDGGWGEGNKGGAGIVLFGGVVRNCLLAGNENNNTVNTTGGDNGGGITVVAGTVENCTIVRNKTRSIGGGVYVTGGTVTNTIIYYNGASVSSNINTATGVSYSCAPELTADMNGNRVADPIFEETGAGYGLTCTPGDYRLKPRSPCANGGTNSVSWMSNAVDLAGGPRILNNIVDMGAYEVQLLPPGSVFRFR